MYKYFSSFYVLHLNLKSKFGSGRGKYPYSTSKRYPFNNFSSLLNNCIWILIIFRFELHTLINLIYKLVSYKKLITKNLDSSCTITFEQNHDLRFLALKRDCIVLTELQKNIRL